MLRHQEHSPAAAVDLDLMNSGLNPGSVRYGLEREHAPRYGTAPQLLAARPAPPGAWGLPLGGRAGEQGQHLDPTPAPKACSPSLCSRVRVPPGLPAQGSTWQGL